MLDVYMYVGLHDIIVCCIEGESTKINDNSKCVRSNPIKNAAGMIERAYGSVSRNSGVLARVYTLGIDMCMGLHDIFVYCIEGESSLMLQLLVCWSCFVWFCLLSDESTATRRENTRIPCTCCCGC
jgi:hypothetical protein